MFQTQKIIVYNYIYIYIYTHNILANIKFIFMPLF